MTEKFGFVGALYHSIYGKEPDANQVVQFEEELLARYLALDSDPRNAPARVARIASVIGTSEELTIAVAIANLRLSGVREENFAGILSWLPVLIQRAMETPKNDLRAYDINEIDFSSDEIGDSVGGLREGVNTFRGRRSEELIGHDFWDHISMAFDFELNEETKDELTAIHGCLVSADPRIWPMTISCLGANDDSMARGLGTAISILDEPAIGPRSFERAAQYQMTHQHTQWESLVEQIIDSPPDWYGVFGRKRDERSVLIRGIPHPAKDYFEKAVRVADAVHDRAEIYPHVCFLATARLLDLGLNPRQIFGVVLMMFVPMIASHAYDRSLVDNEKLRNGR